MTAWHKHQSGRALTRDERIAHLRSLGIQFPSDATDADKARERDKVLNRLERKFTGGRS